MTLQSILTNLLALETIIILMCELKLNPTAALLPEDMTESSSTNSRLEPANVYWASGSSLKKQLETLNKKPQKIKD